MARALLEFESVLYPAVVWGIDENGEWNSPLVLAPQRKDVKCTLRLCVLSKRLCGGTWCQVSLEVNGVGAAEGLGSTAGWTLHAGPLTPQSIFIMHLYAPLITMKALFIAKTPSVCISSNIS